MRLKPFIFIIILISIISSGYGQNVFLRHYSVEDGLLSSEIYAQIQDTSGYLWFATSRGVSRFDGTDFTNFTVKNGLPTNSIITLFLDANGRLWFAGYDGSLSYFNGDKIIPYKYLDTVKALSQSYFINNLYVDENFNLYFAPNSGGFYKIDSSGHVFDLLKNYPKNFNYIIQKIGNQYFFIKNNIEVKPGFKVKFTDSALFISTPPTGLRRHVIKKDNAFYVSFANRLYLISQGRILEIKKYPQEISGLYLDKTGKIWVSVLYTGAYVYTDDDFNHYYLLLKRKSPIRVLQDNENSYWLSTTESGVYYLPGFNFYNYNEYGFSDFNIISIASLDTMIYFSTFDQQLFNCIVHDNVIKSINNIDYGDSTKSIINDILATPDGTVWFLGNYLLQYKNHQIKAIQQVWRGYSLALSNDGGLLVTTSYGFYKFCGTKLCYQFTDPRVPTSNSIYQDDKGTIWLGSINGLFSLIDDSLYSWGQNVPILKTRINDIAQYKNYILLATSGLGFIALNPGDTTIINITSAQGLTSDFITHILVQDSVIWLGTNKGLTKITVTDSQNFKYKLENYTSTDGLYAEEVRDLAPSGNAIFLATSRGLVSFFPKKLKKQYIYPKILIDSITIDGKRVNFTDKIIIKPSQHSLTIYFKAISFRAGKNIIYRYKIQGYDNNWNITKNRYIRIPNLPGGRYTIYLTAAAEPNIWTDKVRKIQIIKRQHFTQTTTFYILIFTFFILVIALISHFRIKAKRRQIEQERQLMLAEQRALRSQMNPHFIFNALNSIRRFILENDIDKADYYLTSFATLMRKVLDNSRQNFITLENELQTLKLYLELEHLRFDESFDFEIKVDPSIDIYNWLIPPMIIQPFVENAIWHGLALKKSDGKLLLEFQKKGDKVLCIIQDNGIGRKRAQQIAAKRKGHKSTGLSNTAERLDLISRLYGKKISLKIIDLYDENNEPAGTRVEILFPNFAQNNSNTAN